MKTLIHIAVAILLVFAGCPQALAQNVQQEQTEDLVTVSGVVKDRETGRPVANANVIGHSRCPRGGRSDDSDCA